MPPSFFFYQREKHEEYKISRKKSEIYHDTTPDNSVPVYPFYLLADGTRVKGDRNVER